MNPSEWAITRIETLSVHYPIVWVEDPYSLIDSSDLGALTSKLSHRGRLLVEAANAFRLYEQLQNHDPSVGNLVVIDRSCTPREPHLLPKDCKPTDFKPITAPHWKPFVPREAFFRPTIREFLRSCTDDQHWPVEVDLYPYETLARKEPGRFVEAYENFVRSGRPLTSEDLVMIGASAVFGKDLLDINNPLVALEIAFHNQQKWDELEEYFNASEIKSIRKHMGDLRFPMGDLFDSASDSARLAITALIVLRQHFNEPGKYLSVLSPTLSVYQECNVGLCTEAPSWFLGEEVPLLEKLLHPGFTKFLYSQLGLNDQKNAQDFYQSEHYSQKLRDIVPFAMQPTLSIDDSKRDEFSLSNLVSKFMKAKQTLEEVFKTTKPAIEKLRLTPIREQSIGVLKQVFIDKKLHLVDQLVGELFATKIDIEGPAKREWRDLPGFEARWKEETAHTDSLMSSAVRLGDDLDYLFGKLLEARYADIVPGHVLTPDLFYTKFIGPRRRSASGGVHKATILLLDSLRFDIWRQLIRPMLERDYEIQEDCGFSRLPSDTHVSRRAFFSGRAPGLAPMGAEDQLFAEQLRAFHGKDLKLRAVEVRQGMAFAVQSEDGGTYAGVFDFTDRISHEIAWSPHILQEALRALLREIMAVLLERGREYLVFITSDHGHIRTQRGSPVYLPTTEVGYRSGYLETKVEGPDASHLFQIPAKILGHGEPGWYVFPKPGFYLRPRDQGRGRPQESYRHGGISLFEVMVPLVCLQHRSVSAKIRMKAEIRGKVEVGKTADLMVALSTDGIISSPIKICGDTDDIQPLFVSEVSSVPKTVVLKFVSMTPGRRDIKIYGFIGDDKIGDCGLTVQVEAARVPEDPAALKLKKIFGDL